MNQQSTHATRRAGDRISRHRSSPCRSSRQRKGSALLIFFLAASVIGIILFGIFRSSVNTAIRSEGMETHTRGEQIAHGLAVHAVEAIRANPAFLGQAQPANLPLDFANAFYRVEASTPPNVTVSVFLYPSATIPYRTLEVDPSNPAAVLPYPILP